MMQAGAVLGPIERSTAAKPTPGGPITPVHDLNMPYEGPYEGTEEYETETPTAEMLFPPVSLIHIVVISSINDVSFSCSLMC